MRRPKTTADALIESARAVTSKWMKQRKAEERHASVRRNRIHRMSRWREDTIKDLAYAVMEQAYLKASANGTLPAHARQIMYQARPLIQAKTEKPLNDQYFCQQLLPNYMQEKGVDWNVVYDDRGHFTEPHTGHEIGLGTLAVRKYLTNISAPAFLEPKIQSASVATQGPDGRFGGVLFIEKEGFMPLFEAVHLAERHDLALMSTKGLSVTAARLLIDRMCGRYKIPLFVLHDFDKSGFSILGTLRRATRRYTFGNSINVIDLGLRLNDVTELDLEAEQAFDRGEKWKRRENLQKNGATEKEIAFLLHRRVELNALPSDELIEWIERKLKNHGVKKIIPNKEQLARAYRLFVRGKRIVDLVKKIEKDDSDVPVPGDLERRVKKYLTENRAARWDHAVGIISKEDGR